MRTILGGCGLLAANHLYPVSHHARALFTYTYEDIDTLSRWPLPEGMFLYLTTHQLQEKPLTKNYGI